MMNNKLPLSVELDKAAAFERENGNEQYAQGLEYAAKRIRESAEQTKGIAGEVHTHIHNLRNIAGFLSHDKYGEPYDFAAEVDAAADFIERGIKQPKDSPMDGTIAGVLAAVLKYGESCREVALSSAGQLSAKQRQGEAYGEVLNGLTALCLSEAVREYTPNAEAVMDALRKLDPNAYTERGEESWGDDGEEIADTFRWDGRIKVADLEAELRQLKQSKDSVTVEEVADAMSDTNAMTKWEADGLTRSDLEEMAAAAIKALQGTQQSEDSVTVTTETPMMLANDAIAQGEREGNNPLLVFGHSLKAMLEHAEQAFATTPHGPCDDVNCMTCHLELDTLQSKEEVSDDAKTPFVDDGQLSNEELDAGLGQ